MAKCIVLKTTQNQTQLHEPKLREILAQNPELVSVVGVDCQAWEEAIDWLYVDQEGEPSAAEKFCCTTSHENETLAEVIDFATQWKNQDGDENQITIVEI